MATVTRPLPPRDEPRRPNIAAADRQLPAVRDYEQVDREISGTLDESLRRLQTYYHEEGSRRMHLLAQWVPRAVYLLVALLIAYKVIDEASAAISAFGLGFLTSTEWNAVTDQFGATNTTSITFTVP